MLGKIVTGSHYILGKILLQNEYIVFIYEEKLP